MTVALKETDVLPPMRDDLVVVGTPHPTTADLVTVQDPVSKRTVRFRGFELSLARLLDGKRTAADVIDAARGLGIPLSLAGLQNFGAKLNAIGFLARAGQPAPKHKTTWKPRPLWSPEVREQFRSALKDAREDRLDQARGYLEQVLKADPTVQDAIELVAWIDQRKLALAAKPAAPLAAAPVDILSAAGEPAPPTKSFGEVFADADLGWYADVAALEESIGPRPSRSKRRVVGLLLVAAAAAALLVPVPRTVTTRYTLVAEDDVAMTAPQAGTVSVLKVAEGQWVEAEDVLLQLTDTGRAEQLAALDQRIAELEAKAAASPPKEKKKKSKGRSSQSEQTDEVQRFLRKAKSERQALMQKSPGVPVTALTSGFVQGLTVKQGATVEADAALCHLVASKHLVAKLEVPYGAPVATGQRATLKLIGRAVEVTLESANRTTAEATLDNEDNALAVGTHGEARIAIGKRTFLAL